jgi:hypothetical protein
MQWLIRRGALEVGLSPAPDERDLQALLDRLAEVMEQRMHVGTPRRSGHRLIFEGNLARRHALSCGGELAVRATAAGVRVEYVLDLHRLFWFTLAMAGGLNVGLAALARSALPLFVLAPMQWLWLFGGVGAGSVFSLRRALRRALEPSNG